jgi:hypothetical protein
MRGLRALTQALRDVLLHCERSKKSTPEPEIGMERSE